MFLVGNFTLAFNVSLLLLFVPSKETLHDHQNPHPSPPNNPSTPLIRCRRRLRAEQPRAPHALHRLALRVALDAGRSTTLAARDAELRNAANEAPGALRRAAGRGGARQRRGSKEFGRGRTPLQTLACWVFWVCFSCVMFIVCLLHARKVQRLRESGIEGILVDGCCPAADELGFPKGSGWVFIFGTLDVKRLIWGADRCFLLLVGD